MIDSYFRPPFQKLLIDPIARRLVGVPANLITALSCLLGLAVIPLLAFDFSIAAASALIFSGYLDALDGTIARLRRESSPFGTVLDICADRVVESAVVIGLLLVDPDRALLCLAMLASILLCITSFLVVGIFSENDSHKSFHYSPGLIERAEAFLFFLGMMLLPTIFAPLATAFAALVILTAVLRIRQFGGQCKLQRVPQERERRK